LIDGYRIPIQEAGPAYTSGELEVATVFSGSLSPQKNKKE
jgi:hypothetical protein